MEHSWWWGHYLGQRGKKSLNTGWESELKIRLFDNETQHGDGCRAELLWSLVEMPVGHKSMEVKLPGWYLWPGFTNIARGLLQIYFCHVGFVLVGVEVFWVFVVLLLYFSLLVLILNNWERTSAAPPSPWLPQVQFSLSQLLLQSKTCNFTSICFKGHIFLLVVFLVYLFYWPPEGKNIFQPPWS